MVDGQWLDGAAATTRIRVRYGETDQMGVVYHPNYLVWFNDARDAVIASLGLSADGLERGGLRFPVIEASCRYRHSARYGDDILVMATPLHTPVAKLIFRYEARNARSRRLLAEGTTTSVITDERGRLLLRLPAEIRDALDRAAATHQNEKAGYHHACQKNP